MADAAKYRYPGPPEFEDTPGDRQRFFGRSSEINTVSELVVASRLLVVYGNSGLGKSSLLKAGVFPKLRGEGLLPIRVRLDRDRTVSDLLRDACQDAARDTSREMEVDYTPGAGGTVWEFFKTVMFWHGDSLLIPVLVFDQFEEIFTLADAAWRKAFAREIGPLVSGNAPSAVREKLKSGTPGVSDQAPKVKIVFCLREEYYGSLQELSAHFPGLFQDRFRLQPLNTNQAELAIVEPARLAAESFLTPPFEYEQTTLDSMLAFLRGKSRSVEPFQLQLLCQFVEQVVVGGKQTSGDGAPIRIKPEDLGGENAMQQVIKRFYTDSLDHLPAGERGRARELCDTGLLSESGNRLMLEEHQIHRDYKVGGETLRYLADERRILRQEPRLDSTFYEISHDTIARSIFESRKWRVPRKWRLAGAVSMLFMLALGAFAFWALLEKSKAESERGKAEIAEQKAVAASKNADSQRKQAMRSEAMAKGASEEAGRSRTDAENKVAFLMGEDFLAVVRPMGKLNVFEEIQKAVPCNKDAQAGIEYDNVGLRNLGLACMNAGEIDYRRFRLHEAGSDYERARKYFAELARRQGKPDDPDLADSLMKEAQVASDQLDFDNAVRLTRRSLEIQEHIAAKGASGHKVSRDLAENYVALGELRRKQGYLREALANFEKVIALAKPFSVQSQISVEWLYLLQDGLLGRGEVLALQGDRQNADSDYRQAYDYAKQAVTMSPFAPEAKYREGVAISKLPLSAGQNAAEMLHQYENVLADVASAAAWDPENKIWARDLAATHLLLAEALVKDRKWDAAARHYQTAIGKVEELSKIDLTNRQLQSDMLVWMHESLGLSYLQQDSATAAKFSAATKPAGGDTAELESNRGKKGATSPQSMAMGEFRKAQELLRSLARFAAGDQEIHNRMARIAIQVANLQRSDPGNEAFRGYDFAERNLMVRDATDANYWEFKNWLEQERGAAFAGKGEGAKAGKSFAAAAAGVDRLLAAHPSSAKYWNDKNLLFYDHFAVLAKSKKDTVGTLKAYQQALEACEKAASLDANEPVYKSNLALAYQQVGEAFRNQGQMSEAQRYFSEADRVWRQLIQTSEDASYWNRLFLLLYDYVAPLREQQKDRQGALQAYVESLDPVKTAIALDPNDPTYQNNLALAEQRVGDGRRDKGQFDLAQNDYAESEKAWRKAIQLKESTGYWNRLFLLYYDHLATLRSKQKDQPGVWKAYENSLEFVQKAVALDPNQPVYQGSLALVHQKVGDALRDRGQLSEAREHYRYSYDAAHKAVTLGPKEAVYRRYSAEALWRIALEETERGKKLETYRLADQDLQDAVALMPEEPGNASWRAYYYTGRYAVLHNGIAPLLSERQDKAGELKALTEALSAARESVALEKENASYQSNLGEAYLSVGDRQDKVKALESYANAVQALREAVRLKPNESSYWASLTNALGSQGIAQEKRGEVTAAQTCYREALNALEQAGKLNPDAKMSGLKDDLLKRLGASRQ